MAEKFNIYDMITNRILDMMDKGVVPWRRPWFGSTLCLKRTTGKPYSFLNQMLLSPKFDGTLESLNSGEFATFNQIKKEGGTLNKGAKGFKVVFWKPWPIKEKDENGEETERFVPVLRYSTVFNIKDTDLAPKWEREQVTVAQPDEAAEEMLTNYWSAEGIKVNRDDLSGRAFYRPFDDSITLPRIDQFESTAEYYSTAFHESVHSTGHRTRLNRIKTEAHFGDKEYSKEELVAEIGASALVGMCGLETPDSFANSVAYIRAWRDAIAKDNKLLVSATSRAEKAVERIMNPVAKMI